MSLFDPPTDRESKRRIRLRTLKVEDECKNAFEEYCRGLERTNFEEKHELRRVTQTEALRRLLETPEARRVRGGLPRHSLG